MTRIVAGSAGGRQLVVPPGRATRPTSDRAREGLFNSLATLVDLDGARVADLYAGSGAVGLEALSRGASHVLLVDRDPAAIRALRRNVTMLGLPGAEILQSPVTRVVQHTSGNPYDVVFLDPPYAMSDAEVGEVLSMLAAGAWLTADGVCVVERSHRSSPVAWPAGLRALRDRRYGEGVLWYGIRS
ncbi:RNA methyltransferase, RsmD family [Frankia canadensis]|uniref:RNA methyltransferase, RsmD family n=1 Tax=Frankia canadensis TaxID=1836972 RepID=A0A2I2KJ95_9ACTN|nr:16S rRNA (guanine(966)-N(2))-methyltransferase RsmD [Frankia canadensis]SNQ45738.1 RNA methyltransferase, RsmD family [Frankia canadensis]SOU53028.1 RNA methyltransferase, RsmD family [Frankia canadensis]